MDEDITRTFKAAMVLCGVPDRQIAKILSKVRDLYRRGISDKLIAVLDAYYEKVDNGEMANLSEMARAAGVNHGSLRQAKIKYDAHRKRSTEWTIKPSNNLPS